MAAKQISLILLIHKEKNQVLYAESGEDFIDILLSFLTMPIGTIVRLAGKRSNIGCLDMLYESVKDLDVQYLQTEACKNMLIHPKSASEEQCKNLMVNINDTEPTEYYICRSPWPLSSEINHLASTVLNAQCHCGRAMDWKISKKKSNVVVHGKDGVFVKGKMRFIIRDDLRVSPVCMTTSLELLKKFSISDATVLEGRKVILGTEEVLHLLKRSLLSKTPLTDVFLPQKATIDWATPDFKVPLESKDVAQSQDEKEINSDSNKMSVKLLLRKSNNKVLYAQGGKEFPDLLFSFLAFPLGSIVKCLGGCTGMGCLDNLYKSVEELSDKDCMKSEEYQSLLLDPMLTPYFGSTNRLFQIKEQVPCQLTIFNCYHCICSHTCITDGGPSKCSHGYRTIQLEFMNPKFPNVVTELGGAFIAGPATFMVTDELIVKPLSTISGILHLNQFNIPISDLEERVVSMGEGEALSLLKASLVSKTVLSDVFSVKKPKQLGMGSYKRMVASVRDVETEV